ncbi:hypothetical protein [Streptomyces sp. B6B3]|uniref:hypothetical protein n=1 Tax=Streptomyces sp. B6B3 TaxID=3153570 RepID=UPI00325D9DF6
MTTNEARAGAPGERRRRWRVVGALVAVAAVAAGYLLLVRGDEGGARATARAAAEALNESDDAAYRALTCRNAGAALRPDGEVPEVDGDVSVAGVLESDGQGEEAAGALATLETTRVGEYFALGLDETGDGWCLASFEACDVDDTAEDNPYVPACPPLD